MSKSNRWNAIAIILAMAFATQTTVAQEVAAIDSSGESVGGESAGAEGVEASEAARANSPEPTIETFHSGLLEIMKNAKTLGMEGRIEKLAPLMAATFDLEFMASKTVGRHWKKLSDDDKVRWSEIFARFTTANYAGRFTGFTGEEFVTVGVEDGARGTLRVLTKIVIPDEEDVQLNYRLIEKNGKWRVIDVYLNGTVSELALRRSEYSSALKRDGFDQLVDSIETKIADLKAKDQAEG